MGVSARVNKLYKNNLLKITPYKKFISLRYIYSLIKIIKISHEHEIKISMEEWPNS